MGTKQSSPVELKIRLSNVRIIGVHCEVCTVHVNVNRNWTIAWRSHLKFPFSTLFSIFLFSQNGFDCLDVRRAFAIQCVLMLSGDNCSSVSELAEGYTFIRGRCKQLGNLYNNPNRNDGRCGSGSEYEFIVCADEITSPVDGFEKPSEDICRRLSMSKYCYLNNFTFSWFSLVFDAIAGAGETVQTHVESADDTIADTSYTSTPVERRVSRDIGVQAFSLDFEQEKPTKTPQTTRTHTASTDSTQQTEINVSLRKSL